MGAQRQHGVNGVHGHILVEPRTQHLFEQRYRCTALLASEGAVSHAITDHERELATHKFSYAKAISGDSLGARYLRHTDISGQDPHGGKKGRTLGLAGEAGAAAIFA
ncbi:MAG: hypothetical protein DDT36_01505 [Firmicutes bacterium]|nr:hypothetical protein [Bacillota bacterium]